MCKGGEKKLNKINTFFKKHKTKVIVYSSIFIVVLIISNILLNSAYSFVVSEYEKDPTCIQTCEDGINTLRKMKYYRNSKNYILRMKRSIVENYCDQHDFDEAENYLNRNYQDGMSDMYDKIEGWRDDYEEEQRLYYMETLEGRTKRVEKMYETMGFGGEEFIGDVPEHLVANIEYGDLDSIGYLLPVWNRNNTYLDMLKSVMLFADGDANIPDSTYYVYDWQVINGCDISAEDYEYYLRSNYKIDIDVDSVNVIQYCAMKQLMHSKVSTSQRILVFCMQGKYFVGGIYYGVGENTLSELVSVSGDYSGRLNEEY